MTDTWPTKCCCGESLSSIRGIQFHFDILHEGQHPLYECKKHPGTYYRDRKNAVQHFRRRHQTDKWPSVMRVFPPNELRPMWDEEASSDSESAMEVDPTPDDLLQDENPPQEPYDIPQDSDASENNHEYEKIFENVISDVTGESINQRIMQMLLILNTECHAGAKGEDIIVSFITELLQDLVALKTFPVHQLKNISTAKRRKNYLVEEMGLVLPEKVLLGTIATTTTSSQKRKAGVIQSKVEMLLEGSSTTKTSSSSSAVINEDKFGYVIPVKKSLGQLLKNKDFFNHIVNPGPLYVHEQQETDDEVITSDWRGSTARIIEIFLGLSFDEAEITTPMKQAKTRHKMFIALFELLNIPMRLRKDVTKQLLYICKSTHRTKFKRADEKMLADLIKLVEASKDGIELIEGCHLKFRIHVVQICADNPAAASILRMKVSGGKTEMPCHRCWASKDDIQQSKDMNKPLRTMMEHKQLCDALRLHKNCDTFEEFSKQTGILGSSPLFDIPGFHINKVAVDPMHILLEAGILTRVLQYYLAGLVQEGLVGKEVLQTRLSSWSFYNPDRERSTGTLELNLQNPSQSRISYGAIALLKLAKELPFIIDEYDQDSVRRRLFVKVMRLAVTIMSAPYMTHDAAQRLKHIFHEIKVDFLNLYPAAWLTNKWHAMLHLLEDIDRLGAPKAFSCLQSERKYHTIKQEGVRSAKNVALTLANRTQLITLNQLFLWGPNGRESKTLEPQITKVPMSETDDLKLPPDLRNILTKEDTTRGLKRYTIGRFNFFKGSVVEMSNLTDEQPIFGIIQHISNTSKGVSFVVLKSVAATYNPLFGFYEVGQAIPARVLVTELEMAVTLTSVRHDNKLFVLREYSPFVEYPIY